MYRFTRTDTIDRCVERMGELRDRFDAQGPLPRVWLGRLRRDLEAEATAASTRIEGVAVTVDEVRSILAGDKPSKVPAEDAQLVDGYRDAMRYVLARADASAFSWQSELILGIQDRVLAGSWAQGAGRFREGQNWLTNRATGEQVYLPPPAKAVPVLVDEMCAWINASDEPAPVVSAMAHVAIGGIHPFRDGNGRSARIVASLAMYRGGFKAPQFTSLEEWWGRHVEDYYRAFDCLGRGWDPGADVTPFVEAHVSAQASQVEALSLRISSERALWTVLEDMAVHDFGLGGRATNALYDAFFDRGLTNRYYRRVADVSDVTASHDLGKLVSAGMLVSQGAGRSVHYVASQGLYRDVAEQAGLGKRWIPEGGEPSDMRDLVLTGLAARLHTAGRG